MTNEIATDEAMEQRQIERDALVRNATRGTWRDRVLGAQVPASHHRQRELNNRLAALKARHAQVARQISPAAMMQRLRGEIEAKAHAYWLELDELAQNGALTLADLELDSEAAQCFFYGKTIDAAISRCVGKDATTGEQLSREAVLRSLAEQIATLERELAAYGPEGERHD